jgi:hypothetical protein
LLIATSQRWDRLRKTASVICSLKTEDAATLSVDGAQMTLVLDAVPSLV